MPEHLMAGLMADLANEHIIHPPALMEVLVRGVVRGLVSQRPSGERVLRGSTSLGSPSHWQTWIILAFVLAILAKSAFVLAVQTILALARVGTMAG